MSNKRIDAGGNEVEWDPEDLIPVQAVIADVSSGTAASNTGYIVAPVKGKIVLAQSIIHGAIITAPAVLTITTANGAISETISILHTSSAAGDVDSTGDIADQTNAEVEVGDLIKVQSANASANAVRADVILNIQRTA